jgi:hypothetical protein
MTAVGAAQLRAPIARERILYSRVGGPQWAEICHECRGLGFNYVLPRRRSTKGGTWVKTQERRHCEACRHVGWHGIDPTLPTCAPPGSFERTVVYQARDTLGHSELGLCHPEDAGPTAWNDPDHDWQPLPVQGRKAFEATQAELPATSRANWDDDDEDECFAAD